MRIGIIITLASVIVLVSCSQNSNIDYMLNELQGADQLSRNIILRKLDQTLPRTNQISEAIQLELGRIIEPMLLNENEVNEYAAKILFRCHYPGKTNAIERVLNRQSVVISPSLVMLVSSCPSEVYVPNIVRRIKSNENDETKAQCLEMLIYIYINNPTRGLEMLENMVGIFQSDSLSQRRLLYAISTLRAESAFRSPIVINEDKSERSVNKIQ